MSTLLVAGSRTITDIEKVTNIINQILNKHEINKIIHGDAKGVDKIVNCYKDEYEVVAYPPDWKLYGKSAGVRRNTDMVNDADIVLVIVEDKNNISSGSNDTYKKALNKNKIVYLFDIK